MGFYLRLAPGLRLGLTARGLRASVGPRAARLHFGAGSPGVSTGAGPLTYYRPVRGSSRGSSRGGQAAKLAQAQQINAVWERLFAVHQHAFPAASPRPIPAPASPTLRVFTRDHVRRSRIGIPWWHWIRRLLAARVAREAARKQWPSHLATLEQQHQLAIEQEQRRWASLLANEPATVLAQLQDAFADNDVPSAPVGIEGEQAAVAVLAPPPAAIPERIGGVTDAGNVSLRKLPKGERNSLLTAITCGYALVTLREAFAVAPGIASIRLVVLRDASDEAADQPVLECVMAGCWRRTRLDAADWSDTNALHVATQTADELIMDLRSNALRPLDLSGEPDLQELLAAVEPEDLGMPQTDEGT